MNDDVLHFSVTKNILDHARDKTGKVYVLDKQKFQEFEGMQCQSEESNIPLEVVEINIDDLLNQI